MSNIIKSSNGYSLKDNEARAYVRWCLDNGYEDLSSAPNFELIKNKLKL
jgi:hypothetical protein